MTVISWIGLVLGTLWLLGIRPVAEAVRRLYSPGWLCACCRDLRLAYWTTERTWRYWCGSAGHHLMILGCATEWWTMPFRPFLRRLVGLPALPQCAGPECAAHPHHVP